MIQRSKLELISSKSGYVLAALFFGAILFAISRNSTSEPIRIQLHTERTYQVITGWEATAQAGQFACDHYEDYKDTVIAQAVDELGINRLRLELVSGVENPNDYFSLFIQGQISAKDWNQHRYEIINDNDDPAAIDREGYQFSSLDYTINHLVLPFKQKLEEKGERLYINLTYVDFGSSQFEHYSSPEEFAELMLATFSHLEQEYRWVPDSIEVILEPDNTSGWSGSQVGNAMVSTAKRLSGEGYHPGFIAPSTKSIGQTLNWLDEMLQVPGALSLLSEISYHRYRGASNKNLVEISTRAEQYGLKTAMLEKIGGSYQELHQDLKVGQVSAWQQYTLAFCTEDNGAQYFWIETDDPSESVIHWGTRTRFLQQYFRYVRRGALRIEATTMDGALDPLAFINPDGAYVVVISAKRKGAFTLGSLPSGLYGISYTTGHHDRVELPPVNLPFGQDLNASIPDRGVLTVYALPNPGRPESLPQMASPSK